MRVELHGCNKAGTSIEKLSGNLKNGKSYFFFLSIRVGRIPKSSNLIGEPRACDRSSFLRYGPRVGFFPAQRCT